MGIWGISARRSCIGLCNIRVSGQSFRGRAFSDSKSVTSDDSVLPVLIIGAGPVGLVLSILLTKLGVKCAILEKNKVFSKHPQAHFINNRSMELLFLDISQIGWSWRRDSKISTASRVLEKVYILYITDRTYFRCC